MSMSSSSAASIRSPVVAPWPISTRPVRIDAVLLAWIARNESTWPRSGGPFDENGLSTAFAAFAPTRRRCEADDQRAAALSRTLAGELLLVESSRSSRTCLCHHCRGLLDRGQDSRIRPAAAQMPVHRRADLVLGRVLRRREQVSGLDHHAVLAIAAMRHLHVDPRLLQRMQRRSSSRVPRCAAHSAGSPSKVVMFFPLTAATGVTHERISFPSSNTEQAPHCARPQPNRGPCRWSSLCRT